MAKLQIKLVRSTIGTTPNQRKNVEALGLRKREQVVVKEIGRASCRERV